MTRKDPPNIEGDAADTTTGVQAQGTASHVAPAGASLLNALPGSNAAQFPFVDPSVMMVTNAAATIAAVAASAVQQMAKPSHPTGGGTSPVPPALASAFPGAAAARNLLTAAPPSLASAASTNPPLPAHIAALLGSGGTQSSLSSLLASHTASAATPVTVHASLPSTKVDHSSALAGITGSQAPFPPSHAAVAAMASGSMNNVVVPGMQNWTLDQLGKGPPLYGRPIKTLAVSNFLCLLHSNLCRATC